jgi:hypothetical protein
VNDAVMMSFAQSFGNIADDFDGAQERHFPAREQMAQRLAFDQLHHDEGLAILRFAVIVKGRDVRVAKT